MPTSTSFFKPQTIQYIEKNIDKLTNIIDIGSGIGTYADLLKPIGYNSIDAVEVFEPYIEAYDLKSKYRSVFCQNIIESELFLDDYNLAILGDVVEHMTYADSLIVLKKLSHVKDIIIAVPFQSNQDDWGDNRFEIHIQNSLSNSKFLSMYPDFELFCLRYDYGIYLKKNSTTSNQPIYTIDIPNDDTLFLAEKYPYKNIINLTQEEAQ